MRGTLIRRLLVVLIIFSPVFSYTGCKKQARCGCDGDILFTLTSTQVIIDFNSTGTTITCTPLTDQYSSYNFCNPAEMFPKLADSKPGDILEVSGHAYWECNYLYQSSNYSYQTYYKVYMIQVTDVVANPYGKK
jgi:hypothetical protein